VSDGETQSLDAYPEDDGEVKKTEGDASAGEVTWSAAWLATGTWGNARSIQAQGDA